MSNSNFGHYTSQSGLMGIIRNEAFWATNIKFLNDENEFTHTLDLINEIIKPDILNKNEIPIHKEFIDKVEAKLKYLDRFTDFLRKLIY